MSANYQILHWQDLCLNEDEVRRYIKEHPIPYDKTFKIEDFIKDLGAEGYVCIVVNKRETAEYIADLLYDLV